MFMKILNLCLNFSVGIALTVLLFKQIGRGGLNLLLITTLFVGQQHRAVRIVCISRFTLSLPREEQDELSKFNSDFSYKCFVYCLKLLKTFSFSVFFKAGLLLYVFESRK